MRVGIIGGGAAGLAAAYELTKRGHYAEVFKRTPFLGGQASTFPVGGGQLERGYHHLFVSDVAITDLIHELGLGDKLAWLESKVGLYHGGTIWNFGTPMDLMRFKPLSLLQRIRVGFWTFLLQKTKDWRKFEGVTARDWLVKHMGAEAYRVIWEPLLRGKFGDYYDQVSMTWIWGKIYLRVAPRGKGMAKERLGYPMGSFGEVFDVLGSESLSKAAMSIYPPGSTGYWSKTTTQPDWKYSFRTEKLNPETMTRSSQRLPLTYLPAWFRTCPMTTTTSW